MNILYLTNHLNIGGVTSYVFTLSRGMKQRGHHVYIASNAGELLFKFQQEGANFIPIPIKTKSELSPKIIFSLFKLLKVVKKYNINIIHAHSRTTQVLGVLLAKITKVPYISTCHGFFRRRLLRRIFPCWGNKVIAISEQVREHLIQDFGVKEKDIRLIYNGIDIEKSKIQNPCLAGRQAKSKIELKKNFGLDDGPVVGIVARLSDVKGHIYLIEAMKKVSEIFPTAQLVSVGEGKMKGGLLRRAQELGLEKNIFFLPQVQDTQEILSIMDIFVMPSLKEGLGLALMEAMASGLAVIGSDVGGIKSLIQDGSRGILVKPADAGALSCAIIELLSDPQKREILGMQARKFISENFSEGKMVFETERLYSECIERKN